MIKYSVKGLTFGSEKKIFNTASEAIDFAFHAYGYDNECKIFLEDTQGSGGTELAYQWLNKIHVSRIAGSYFIESVKEYIKNNGWPYSYV